MSRERTLPLIACLIATAAVGSLFWPAPRAGAQPAKIGQKWEYATLDYDEPNSEVGSWVRWAAGEKIFGSKSEKFLLECVSKLNQDLGGKEEKAGISVLLDRIGQGGWELVAYTRAAGQRSVTQTWTFKRSAP